MTFLIQLNEQGEPINHPVAEENFRMLFSKTFPSLLTPQDVQGTGFALYEFSQQPELTRYEKMVEGVPRKSEDGRVFQTWQVVEMDEGEKLDVDNVQANIIRQQRNSKLYRTDWIFAPDSPLNETQKQAYITYRQALRDVPSQAGFPWDVQWPVEP
jgi:hypothetical protein